MATAEEKLSGREAQRRQTRQRVYDCLYVVLAEREGCELLTADQRLLKHLEPIIPLITSLASLP